MTDTTQAKFLCDVNVGKLARWLRILGFDAEFMDPRRDEELILRARQEGRILLTTDRGIADRPYLDACLWVKSRDYREQLHEVLEAFGLRVAPERVFTRCSVCNHTVRPVTKDRVQSRVPARVFVAQDRFFECTTCDRVYWRGSHIDRVLAALREMGLVGD